MFRDPPERLVENGEVRFGLFKSPVKEINASDYILLDEMDREVRGVRKRLRIHFFNYFGVIHPDLTIGIAIYDLAYLGGYFLYIYDHNSGELLERGSKSPFSRGVDFPHRTGSEVISFYSGKEKILFKQMGNESRRIVEVSIPDIALHFTMNDDEKLLPSLSLCTRNSYSGWTYTQKKAGAEVIEGEVDYRDMKIDLGGAKVIFDWTGGFLRRDTYWLWAAGVGEAGGQEFGFNFSNGVNETSWTENAIWLDGKLIKIEGVEFEFNRFNPDCKWRIRGSKGEFELEFRSSGARREKLDLKFIKSNFVQFFGEFEGYVETPDGRRVDVKARGFTEKHFARW